MTRLVYIHSFEKKNCEVDKFIYSFIVLRYNSILILWLIIVKADLHNVVGSVRCEFALYCEGDINNNI